MSSSSQILLHPLPVNVALEDGPLSEARPKRVALGNHPSHHCRSDSHESGMKSVNHGEDHENTEQKPDKPKGARSRSCVLKSASPFERLPATEQLFCFGIHKGLRCR